MLVTLYLFVFLHFVHVDVQADPSVVIIGAGPAGIAAATRLLENSINNITILEAENRIGGRINTVEFAGHFIELGAEFCHGERNNLVYEHANKYNLLELPTKSLENNVYYSNGSKLDPSLVEELGLQEDYEYYAKDNFNFTGKSIGDIVIERYNKKQVEKYKNEKEKLKLAKEGLRYSELFTLTNEGSFSWFDCSADNAYEVCEGNQSLVWKKVGYKTILDILMRSYPDPNKKLPIDDKIHLNTKVQSISWNKSESVTVLTIDNSSYFADHVIFTPSIGVLKQQSDKLFTPSLPSAKREAIEATGFGGVIKIFVHFPTKWWKDDYSFSFFWSEEDLHVDYPHGPRKSGISWITQLVDLEQNINNPNVWSVWFAGDLVPEVEKLPLDVLKNGCEFVFNKFLGKNYNVTAIDQIVRSTWYTNPNFLGAYSFTKTGLYRPDLSYQEVLAEPLNGVEGKPAVLFAGEATNPVHFSTVHGAIETGHREAERIIKLYKRKQ